VHAKTSDFDPHDDRVAVLHYYGAGGWGILWHDSYLLTAPYFSNHGYLASSVCEAVPDRDAIREGFANTPIDKTKVILVGHGHVDHASDIPAYPFCDTPAPCAKDQIAAWPTLVADQSTINLLGEKTRDRFCKIPLAAHDGSIEVAIDGDCSTGDFRIRALPWAHAPHAACESIGLNLIVGDPQGTQSTELTEPPSHGNDWLVGRTWAFLIELLDAGKPVFRIFYVDAAANQGFADPQAVVPDDPTDVHIGCVPGFDYVQGYPEEAIRRHHVKYVLAGHWENFFRDRECSLEPVAGLDDAKMGKFVRRAEMTIGGTAGGSGPINKAKCRAGEDCGPAGESWTVPVPGETFWFRTSAGCPAS
jgi:hypothetical protein